MLRRLPAVFVVLATLLTTASVASAQANVDEIIAKNLAAKGGIDRIKAIKTIKQTSHLTVNGMDASMTIYGKRPNLMRQEMSVAGQTLVTAFDGTTAWMINPMTGSTEAAPVTDPTQVEMAKEQASFEGPLVDYKAKGYTVELVGTETEGGLKVHHLKVGRGTLTQHYYIDADTGLETRMVLDSPMGTIEQVYSDYRDVDGLKMPFLIQTSVAGTAVGQITVDKVEFDIPLDDALFKMKIPYY